MAENSKRERILLFLKEELEEISVINTVIRTIPSMQDLANFANTQFPLVAMVGKLPDPTPHKNNRGPSQKDAFDSVLEISLFVYFQDNVNPDSTLSSILDDIWSKLYTDPTKGGLVYGINIKPDLEAESWEPYYAFKLNLFLTYHHTIGGI